MLIMESQPWLQPLTGIDPDRLKEEKDQGNDNRPGICLDEFTRR